MSDTRLWQQLEDWKKNCRWVELSHVLSPETPHWSGFPAMKDSVLFDYPDGFFVNKFEIVTQYGTHADAPCHFVKGTRGLDVFEAADLVLPLCVVDVSGKVRKNADYELSPQDILDWETAHGRLPERAFVAARTDWHKRQDMDNCDAQGNKHYPGWRLDALKFLVEERNVGAVGHETSDTDAPAAGTNFAGEYYILEQGRYQVELMTNLDQVPPMGAILFCGFPRAKDAAGFTARCIALCPA